MRCPIRVFSTSKLTFVTGENIESTGSTPIGRSWTAWFSAET
jgi:hypothetical protein